MTNTITMAIATVIAIPIAITCCYYFATTMTDCYYDYIIIVVVLLTFSKKRKNLEFRSSKSDEADAVRHPGLCPEHAACFGVP